MDKTINEIVEGSALPVSIIIAGIGDAEFGQMETLDGDEEPLYNPILKKYAERDIVQFVPLNKLRGDPIALAKQVLAEVPRQMTSYFQSRGIKPNANKADPSAIQAAKVMKMQMNQFQGDKFFNSRKMMTV